MNEEIGNFFVKFTTEGLTELKQGMAELNKSMDSLSAGLQQAAGKNDSFFGKFTGWATSVGLLTAAILAVKKAITETFNVAKDVRSIYKLSDTLGVDPETLERWEILARLYDGNRNDVAGFFKGLNTMSLNLREGKYSKELMERMARYGFTEQYLYNASLPSNRDKLIGDLNALLNRRDLDAADIQALQTVFPGLNDTMVDILKAAPDALKKNLEWAESNRALTADPDYERQAVRLRKVEIEFEQIWKRVWADMQGPLADLLEALKPLADPLKDLAANIVELLALLAPIAAWASRHLGGAIGSLVDGIKVLLGKMTVDEFNQKYSKDQTIAGKAYRAMGSVTEWLLNYMQELNNTPVGIDISSIPTDSDLARSVAASPFIASSDKVMGYLEIEWNSEKYIRDPAGNIYNRETGAYVGNIPKNVALSSVK